MSSFKNKLTCKGTWRQCSSVRDTVFIHTGKGVGGGGVEPEKRQRSQSCVENENVTNCIYSLKTLTCRKVPLQVNSFRSRHFAVVSI
jgi:hypothetical protein